MQIGLEITQWNDKKCQGENGSQTTPALCKLLYKEGDLTANQLAPPSICLSFGQWSLLHINFILVNSAGQ